jgi:predicted ATP-dependent endonuclease of OLD family
MMIKKLSIKNYRSIEALNIELNGISAFIGPNNAGKSNILSALNLVLGETYPGSRSFAENDFHNRDTSHPIEIKVIFNSSLGDFYHQAIWGFSLKAYETSGGIEAEYYAVDQNGEVLQYYSGGNNMKVSNEMRDKALVLFFGLNRDIESQLRTTQWTIYGKLLKHLNYKLPQASKAEFDRTVKASTHHLDSEDFVKFKEIMQTVVQENTGLEINMEFQAFDPINLYKDLKLLLKESTQAIQFEAQDMGRGVQGVIALGLLLSYKRLVRDAPMLLIEEPETYLHPHGCRHFYSNLKNLAHEGIQIIYSTHSPFFIPLEDYKNIFLTRKTNGKTVVSHITDDVLVDNLKVVSMFNEKLNETFFANTAILVEGAVDKILLARAFELGEVQPDIKNISIAECGGNGEIKFVSKILTALGINVIVLCDSDAGNDTTRRELEEITEIVGDENILLYDSTLEDEYRIPKLTKVEAIRKSFEYTSLDQFPDVVRNLVNKFSPIPVPV